MSDYSFKTITEGKRPRPEEFHEDCPDVVFRRIPTWKGAEWRFKELHHQQIFRRWLEVWKEKHSGRI